MKALSDDYSRTIMNYTIEKLKSVVDIVKDCDIPMTTAYRRVHELEENKILKVTGSIVTDDGKKYFLYQNRLKAIYVIFGLESLDVQIVENKGMGTRSYLEYHIFMFLIPSSSIEFITEEKLTDFAEFLICLA